MEVNDGIGAAMLGIGAGLGEGEGLGGFCDGVAGWGVAVGVDGAGVLPDGMAPLRRFVMTLRRVCGEEDSKYLLMPAEVNACLTSAAEAVGRSCK